MCGADNYRFKVLGRRLNTRQGKKPKSKIGIATTVCKCNNCGLIFANPLPIPNSIQDHYGVPPEDYWIDEYFETSEIEVRKLIKWLQKITDLKPDLKTLDIGAGIGIGMIAMKKSGYEAYGLEPSEIFYNYAIKKTGIDTKQIKLGAVEELDYPQDFFDFINFGAVLEHLYNPSEVIEKTMSWLKPGGLMHIHVPNADWFIPKLLNFYFKVIGTDYVSNISPMHPPFHLYEFTLKSFQEIAKKNNYDIAEYKYWVSWTYMPKIFDSILKPYMRMTNTGMLLDIWLKK